MTEPLLISACLLGAACRYDGRSNKIDVEKLMQKYQLIPVCPEIYGGLPTPRVPSERIGEKVMNKEGIDVTEQFAKGAEEALGLARLYGCKKALLKEKSPSCGYGRIYDGSFTGTLTEGSGVASWLLSQNGILVLGESQIEDLL